MPPRSFSPARPSLFGKWICIALSVLLGILGTWGASQHTLATSDKQAFSQSTPGRAPKEASAVSNSGTISIIAGGTITTAMPILAQDTFTRQDQEFWGIASYGQAWQGDAAQSPLFSVNGQVGVVAGAQQASSYNAVIGPVTTDSMVVFSGAINNFQNANMGAVLRWQDANNWYKAYLNGKSLNIKKSVNGQVSLLASTAFPARPNLSYTVRFRVIGNALQAQAWQMGMPEPTSWMLTFTDSGSGLSTGLDGLRLGLQAGTRMHITSFIEESQ